MNRFLIDEDALEGFSLPRSEKLSPSSGRATDAPNEDDSYEFDEYEYDAPPGLGSLLAAVLLFPFALLITLWELLFDAVNVVRYLVGELLAQIKDAGFAIGYFSGELVFFLFRLFIAPILFVLSDPVGFFCYQADRICYIFWSLSWHVRLLWGDFWEQLEDVGRLFEMGWWHLLNSLGLANAEPPPVHAVPVREVAGLRSPRILSQAEPKMTAEAAATRQQRERDARKRASVEKRRGFSAVTKSGSNYPERPRVELLQEQDRHRARFQIRPIENQQEDESTRRIPEHPEFKVSLRTRLADERDESEESVCNDSARQSSESWYRLYCCTCPRCQSEEVYPVKGNGLFAESLKERAWLIQNMYCERCLARFRRPGRLLLAPAPLIRPLDTDMYD